MLSSKCFQNTILFLSQKFFLRIYFLSLNCVFLLSSCNAPTLKLEPKQVESEFTEIIETLCQSNIVLMGEGPSHGEGTTLEFKAKIVKSLVSDCGFQLLLFEASFYEFAKLHKIIESEERVKREEIEIALGFIYRDKVQLQNLIEFISHEVSSGSLKVGGLDYQPGGRGQDYSNFEMLREIIPSIETKEGAECMAALKQRIYSNFPKDAPYNFQQKENLLNCLEKPINENQLTSSHRVYMMRENLYNFIERDFMNGRERMAARSSFMYENFKFWNQLFESQPKTIVWSSSSHASKSNEISSAFHNTPNFGSLVKDDFGETAYSLGFSALQGSVRSMKGNQVKLPTAPENSIEFAAFLTFEDDIAFLDAADLTNLGTRQGAAIFNQYEERDWSTIFDGVVVFREQKPALTR